MKRIDTSTWVSRALLVTVFAVVGGSISLASAQGSNEWAVDQVQRAVREQIAADEGNVAVRFAADTHTEAPTSTNRKVRGTGSAIRDRDGKSRAFSYEAVVDTRNSRISGLHGDWRGDWRTAATDRLTDGDRFNRDCGGAAGANQTRAIERALDVPRASNAKTRTDAGARPRFGFTQVWVLLRQEDDA